MTSPHRFLANDRNAATLAAVSASSILPAEATAFPVQQTRQGSARAAITGGYTGADDTLIDIEIVSDTGAGLLSQPVFAGAGNGVLSDLSATGIPSQTFTLLLASTGTPTKRATVDFYGVKLQAKANGAAGNGVRLTVSGAGITATPTAYSFLESAKAGDSQFKGPQWDFGCYQMTADGEIDPRTPRLRFGHDPQIYRQYKTFADGEWKYTLDPPIVRELPAETQVYAITGGYTVTVTAGATTETYTGIITLFDLLNALKTRSNLIDVVGVVVEDKTPGGMAAEDLPLRTDAYALPASYSGSAAFPGLGAVTAPPTAPTEIVTLACKDITTLGGEIWDVSGSVSADLGECTTGSLYRRGGYEWTVPKVLASTKANAAPTGKIYVKDISFANRKEGEKGLELCVKPLVAGAMAKAKTVELIYSKKPANDCPCDSAPTAYLDEKCLGVEIDGKSTMGIVAAYQTRLEALHAWRSTFITSNTRLASGALISAVQDLDLANRAATLFSQCLADLFKESDTPPTAALTYWDDRLTALGTDLAELLTVLGTPTAAVFDYNASYTNGALVTPPVGQETGHSYKLVPGSVELTVVGEKSWWQASSFKPDAAASISNWPIDGSAVSIAGIGTFAIGTTAPTTALLVDQGPYASADAVVGAGSATISHTVESFAERYRAAMDLVRAKAGLVPKSDASGTKGSDCWQPCEGDYEWRVNGLEYLPACTNKAYHSSVKKVDSKGKEVVVSTQEFGFVIRCACPDRLTEGDKITIVIENDAAGVKTYALGDTIKIPIIAGAALELAGGQDGNDTLTWTVRGSVTVNWPDYSAPIGAEPLYDQSGLTFKIKQGGIPFALGDQFTLSVAGGTWRWRRDNGAWSAASAIVASAVALTDGLSVTLLPGPAPAFVAGDRWSYRVKQPHAPKLAQQPDRSAWRWSGNGADWMATFAADTPISAISVWHDCPVGTVLTVAGLSAADAVLWSRPILYRAGLTVAVFEGVAAVAPCRKLRITVAHATGGSIKWLWCGMPWSPHWPLASIVLREIWQIQRGTQSARTLGRSAAGEIAWNFDKNWLNSEDATDFFALLEALKAANDQPFVFVPNTEFPAEARLVRIGTDDIDVKEIDDYQSDRRLYSVDVPLSTVAF